MPSESLFQEMIPDEERIKIFLRNEGLLTLSRTREPIAGKIIEKVGVFVADMPRHMEKVEKAVDDFGNMLGSMQKDGENLMDGLNLDMEEGKTRKKKD